MYKLVETIALFLMVPAVQARQSETKDDRIGTLAQAAPQGSAAKQSDQNSPPTAIRPGYSLDPVDVEVLTGKLDREIAAARRAVVPVLTGSYGGYGYYGDYFWMNDRPGGRWDIPMLPLARITNPIFFSPIPRRGFHGGGFGGRR